MKNKACFLDRDGVVIEDADYISDPELVHLIPGAAEAVNLFHAAGYLVILVSNQSGIARGYFTEAQLRQVEARINEKLSEQGAVLDGAYYCRHHTKGIVPEFSVDCDCRKPKPGLLLQAAAEHGIDLSRSFIIGDKVSDTEAGFRAGCARACLVRTGHGQEEILPEKENLYEAPSIREAAALLLRESAKK